MAPGDCCPPQPFQRLRQRNLTWGYWCQGGIGLPFRRDGIRSSSPSLGCGTSDRITCPENNPEEAEHRGSRSSRADCRPEDLIAEAGEPADQVAGGSLARLLIEEGLAEFPERPALRQQVEGCDQDLVGDRQEGAPSGHAAPAGGNTGAP